MVVSQFWMPRPNRGKLQNCVELPVWWSKCTARDVQDAEWRHGSSTKDVPGGLASHRGPWWYRPYSYMPRCVVAFTELWNLWILLWLLMDIFLHRNCYVIITSRFDQMINTKSVFLHTVVPGHSESLLISWSFSVCVCVCAWPEKAGVELFIKSMNCRQPSTVVIFSLVRTWNSFVIQLIKFWYEWLIWITLCIVAVYFVSFFFLSIAFKQRCL